MHPRRTVFGLAVTALALTATPPTKAHAQHASTTDAMSATRVVLRRKGYEVVRVVQNGDAQVICPRLLMPGRSVGVKGKHGHRRRIGSRRFRRLWGIRGDRDRRSCWRTVRQRRSANNDRRFGPREVGQGHAKDPDDQH